MINECAEICASRIPYSGKLSWIAIGAINYEWVWPAIFAGENFR